MGPQDKKVCEAPALNNLQRVWCEFEAASKGSSNSHQGPCSDTNGFNYYHTDHLTSVFNSGFSFPYC